MWSTGFEFLPVQLHGTAADETELICPQGSVLVLGKELMNGKCILTWVSFWCDMSQLTGLVCSCADLYQVRILPNWGKSPLLCQGVLWDRRATGWAHSKPLAIEIPSNFK